MRRSFLVDLVGPISAVGPQRWHASSWVRWRPKCRRKSVGNFPGFPLENDLKLVEFFISVFVLKVSTWTKTLASSSRIFAFPRNSTRIVSEGCSIDCVNTMNRLQFVTNKLFGPMISQAFKWPANMLFLQEQIDTGGFLSRQTMDNTCHVSKTSKFSRTSQGYIHMVMTPFVRVGLTIGSSKNPMVYDIVHFSMVVWGAYPTN